MKEIPFLRKNACPDVFSGTNMQMHVHVKNHSLQERNFLTDMIQMLWNLISREAEEKETMKFDPYILENREPMKKKLQFN